MAAASRIWVQDLMRFMGHALRNGLGLFHLRVERHQQEEQEVQDSAEPRHQGAERTRRRSEEHTSELQSLMRISYAVFCLKKKNNTNITKHNGIYNRHTNTQTPN